MEAIGRLAGLQTQESTGPYLGLWSRLRGFDRSELTAAVVKRLVLVATLQRVTMHMVTADDHRWLQPTLRSLHERARQLPSIRDADHDAILAEALRRLPARMPDLRDLFGADANPGHVAGFFQTNLPLVRIPPAGTWRVHGSALQEVVEVGTPDPARLVTSYLAAFGPATVADAQAWSGLRRLAAVFASLELEDLGGGYFDLPGAARPPGDTPAPVRFLPRWENMLIGYADRRRFGEVVIGEPTVLVDGAVAGTWRWTGDDVEVLVQRRLRRDVEDERQRLRDWLAVN